VTVCLEKRHVVFGHPAVDVLVVTSARTAHPHRWRRPEETEMSIQKLSAKLAQKLEHARAVREFTKALDEAPTPASRHELELLARR
jgi:hypothetical protein